MHRDERVALALRLFGTGKPKDDDGAPEPLGALRPEWVLNRFDISPESLRKWRMRGVPRDRVDEVIEAVTELLPDTKKEAAPSTTKRLLTGVMALEAKSGVTSDELSSAEAAMEAALEADARLAAELGASRRRSSGRAGDQDGAQSGGSKGNKRRKP